MRRHFVRVPRYLRLDNLRCMIIVLLFSHDEVSLFMITLSFLLHDQKKRNPKDSPNPLKEGAINNLNSLLYSCRALPKIWGRSNFGGDTTRCAQTVSPLSEIPAPFLTPDTMPEDSHSRIFVLRSNATEGWFVLDVRVVREILGGEMVYSSSLVEVGFRSR